MFAVSTSGKVYLHIETR